MVNKIKTPEYYEKEIDRLEKEIHDVRSLLNVSKTLYEKLDVDKVLETIAYSCIGLVFAKEASIFLHKELEEDTFFLKHSRGNSEAERLENKFFLKNAKPLINFFEENKNIVLVSEMNKYSELSYILKDLEKLSPVVIVPLRHKTHKGEIVGFLILGDKLNETPYNDNELKFLETLSGFAAISVENARLYEKATQDYMTKLYNHGYFQVGLDEELEKAKKYKESLSLIIFDIDNFKLFNDTYGHQTGDMVIIGIGQIIKKVIALNGFKNAIPARYGGEEFAIILPLTTWEEAGVLAEDLRSTIENSKFKHEDKFLNVTCSFGVSSISYGRNITKTELVDEADSASYKSKQKGKNAVTISDMAKIQPNNN